MVTGLGIASAEKYAAGKGGWILRPLTIISLLLLLLSFTGGSSWGHEVQLSLLRPVAVLVAAWGLARMEPWHWRDYGVVWVLLSAAALLTALHLVPLPYDWWSALPGRELIVQIDAASGLGEQSRPLSMHPDATANALVSLVVPLAVLSLAVQLDESARRRLAALLLVLVGVSALVGLVQLSGTQLSFYRATPDTHPSGLFANRNHQAALLALAPPLSALAWQGGFGLGFRARTERFAALALILLIVPLVLVTGSRMGLLATGAGLLCALLVAAGGRERATASWKPIVALLAGVAIVAGLVLLTTFAARDEALNRMAAAGEDLRYPVWESIAAVIPAYWPWGTGIGSYAAAYQVLEPAALLRPTFSNHAHNEWLEIAFTAGLPGMGLLVLAALAFIVASYRASRAGGRAGVFRRIGVSMIIVLAIASSADYPLRTPILAALLAIAATWATREGGQSSAAGVTRLTFWNHR